jgi:hypothetical protein
MACGDRHTTHLRRDIRDDLHQPTFLARADENENPHTWARKGWVRAGVDRRPLAGPGRPALVHHASHAPSAWTGSVVLQSEMYKQLWSGTFDHDTDYCSAEYS